MLQRSAILLVALCACGSEPAPQEPVQPASTGGAERAPRSGMEVSGLMGTIPERKIRATLEPKLPAFARCFARGAAEVEAIGGSMEFYFRVALDGSVEWVYPRASSVGHRATEQCLLDIARAVRFPGPKGGGAAELAWSFEFEPSVRPPVDWDSAQLAQALASSSEALGACELGQGELEITLYVAPGGTVQGVGAAASSQQAADKIDCALEVVRGWTLPDPGSYAAKVSARVP
jgi:hypothetical protein